MMNMFRGIQLSPKMVLHDGPMNSCSSSKRNACLIFSRGILSFFESINFCVFGKVFCCQAFSRTIFGCLFFNTVKRSIKFLFTDLANYIRSCLQGSFQNFSFMKMRTLARSTTIDLSRFRGNIFKRARRTGFISYLSSFYSVKNCGTRQRAKNHFVTVFASSREKFFTVFTNFHKQSIRYSHIRS